MIYGVGTDILDNSRLSDYEKSTKLASKILSITELNIYQELTKSQAVKYLAKQFTCKEAISKAFGTGIRGDVVMSNMEILRDNQGKPYLNALGKLRDYMDSIGITATHCSISDTNLHTISICILENG
jgi:holo-[acyl-carrier protein] synthase|tara:strand:- start:5651 stop:6031 length:381 start_codon:yes stop_codon:yes gene_type:complete